MEHPKCGEEQGRKAILRTLEGEEDLSFNSAFLPEITHKNLGFPSLSWLNIMIHSIYFFKFKNLK